MKRRLTKLVVFLLLGAIVNVAVAWGCVLSFPVVNQPGVILREPISPESWEHRSVQRTVGRTRINWLRYERRPYPLSLKAGSPAPSRITVIPDQSGSRELTGWPLRALTCANPTQSFLYDGDPSGSSSYYDFGPTPLSDVVNGITVGHESVGGLIGRSRLIWRALPYQPIWPGFAISTVFYAVTLWLLLFNLSIVRRYARFERGHCPRCGYELRGDFSAGCPECGWRREDVS